MATRTPFFVINHTRRVCSLYKKWLRLAEDRCIDRAMTRYNCALIRQKFESKKNIKDMVVAKKLLEDAEEDYFWQAPYTPFKFPKSIGGNAYEREAWVPDHLIDFWDPVEKAFYPEYFKRREQLKKEYKEMWVKKYGTADIQKYKVLEKVDPRI